MVLLGNYRITLFTHVSGEYELITGQRSWERMNQGKGMNSGSNSSTLYSWTHSSYELGLVGQHLLYGKGTV